jgi:DNA-directed RNA polymerase alpha subunit
MSENELLSLRNFGQKSLVELREKLQEHGVLPEGEAAGAFGASANGSSDGTADVDDDSDEE